MNYSVLDVSSTSSALRGGGYSAPSANVSSLLHQKDMQIHRLESLLASQTDTHLASHAALRSSQTSKLDAVQAKGASRLQRSEEKANERIAKLAAKVDRAAEREAKADGLAMRCRQGLADSESRVESLVGKVADLEELLKKEKDKNLYAMNSSMSLDELGRGGDETAKAVKGERQDLLLSELGKTRSLLLAEREVHSKDRARADDLQRDNEAKAARIAAAQDGLQCAADEQARLSRSLEQDRTATAELRRGNEDLKRQIAAQQTRFEQELKDLGRKSIQDVCELEELRMKHRKLRSECAARLIKSFLSRRVGLSQSLAIGALKAATAAAAARAKEAKEAEKRESAREAAGRRDESERDRAEAKMRAAAAEVAAMLEAEKARGADRGRAVEKAEADARQAEMQKHELLQQLKTSEDNEIRCHAEIGALQERIRNLESLSVSRERQASIEKKTMPAPATTPATTSNDSVASPSRAAEDDAGEDYGEDFEDDPDNPSPSTTMRRSIARSLSVETQQQQQPSPRSPDKGNELSSSSSSRATPDASATSQTQNTQHNNNNNNSNNSNNPIPSSPLAASTTTTTTTTTQKSFPSPHISRRTHSMEIPTTPSDAINSAVIQLRFELERQNRTIQQLQSELHSINVERNVAVEQAGAAKLEALELAAKLEVRAMVNRMDEDVETTGSAQNVLKDLSEPGAAIVNSAYTHLHLGGEILQQHPMSATFQNRDVANMVQSQSFEVAEKLYAVYRGVLGDDGRDSTTGAVQAAARGAAAATAVMGGGRPASPEEKLLHAMTQPPSRDRSRSPQRSSMAGDDSTAQKQRSMSDSAALLNRSVRFNTPAPEPPPPPSLSMNDLNVTFQPSPSSFEPQSSSSSSSSGPLPTPPPLTASTADLHTPHAEFILQQLQRQQQAEQQQHYPAFSQLGDMSRAPNAALPRLMGDLRKRVSDEIYAVGEQLFNIVDADFRESLKGGKERNKNPVTDIERWQFKKVLHKASHGTLRWLLLIYLRTYDSLEDMMTHKTPILSNSTPGQFRQSRSSTVNTSSPGQFRRSSRSPTRSASPSGSDDGYDSGDGGNRHDERYLPKQQPSDILRERMQGLLEDIKVVWESERRDLNKAGAGSLLHDEIEQELGHVVICGNSALPFHRTQRRRANHVCPGVCEVCVGDKEENAKESSRRNKLNFLDSGAGPREFWSTVSPSIEYHETKGDIANEDEVEQHMWRLILLVRCQDRSRGLRLQRHESQRKLLDLRMYELLLLYIRITLLKEKSVDIEVTTRGGQLKLKFLDIGKWAGKNFDKPSFSQSNDGKNFARLSREFAKVRKDRNPLGSSRSESMRASALRADARPNATSGTIVHPGGHTAALEATVRKGKGGYHPAVKLGTPGMLDVPGYGDRKDFF